MMINFLNRSGTLFLLFAVFATTRAAIGSVNVALVIDPPTTAGFGRPTVPRDYGAGSFSVTSNKSGPGTFHLYALDGTPGSFGISYFSVQLDGNVSNVFNRSPTGVFDTLDANGDSVENANGSAGFSDPLLRSGTAPSLPTNPVQGAQMFSSVFKIGGMGQTAGNLNNTLNLPIPPSGGSRSWSAVTSGAWGDDTLFLPGTTGEGVWNPWLFIGEGNYTGQAPTIENGKAFYYSTSDLSSQGETTSGYACLACFPPTVKNVDVNANDPELVSLAMSFQPLGATGPFTWSNFTFDSFVPEGGGSGTGPTIPATFSGNQFTWNTAGSPLGTYKWLVTGANTYGHDQGSITVHITAVPEPATISLLGLTLSAFCICKHRHR